MRASQESQLRERVLGEGEPQFGGPARLSQSGPKALGGGAGLCCFSSCRPFRSLMSHARSMSARLRGSPSTDRLEWSGGRENYSSRENE